MLILSKNNLKSKEGDLLELIKDQFVLDIDSIHGISHWQRVKKIGLYLASHTKADIAVVTLFAYLHDSKRENDGDDLDHGLRASIFVKDLRDKKVFDFSDKQLKQLCFACQCHNIFGIKSDDITVQTCWDADRLDLWRVGIAPDIEQLNTDIAKQYETLKFSERLSRKS